VDRFSKITRAVFLERIDAETIAAAFLDYWVAAFGPPATVQSDNGPQFRSTFFQGVCSLLGISNRYSTTYHPQTNGQVKRYNRTIVGHLRTYVEDHQDRWDELVSILTLAYNSRPQQSTGVAPLEFFPPERVRSLSVERMVGSPTPEETDGSPRAIREVIRERHRILIHKVRRSLTLAQRRYKRNYDARVRPVNKEVQAGDWVFVDGHARTKYKDGTRAAGPYKVLTRGEGTFSLEIVGYPETVSSDHVTAAPGPPGDPWTLLQNLGVPQDVVVPEGHQHTGKELDWEAFVGHEVADDGTLRLWTRWWGYHPEEDTLEMKSRCHLRKVHQYMRWVGLRVEETGSVVDFLAQGDSRAETRGFQVSSRGRPSAVTRVRVGARGRGGNHHFRTTGRWSSRWVKTGPSRPDRMDTPGGRRHETADQYESVGLRAAKRDGDLTRGARGSPGNDTQTTHAGFFGR